MWGPVETWTIFFSVRIWVEKKIPGRTATDRRRIARPAVETFGFISDPPIVGPCCQGFCFKRLYEMTTTRQLRSVVQLVRQFQSETNAKRIRNSSNFCNLKSVSICAGPASDWYV